MSPGKPYFVRDQPGCILDGWHCHLEYCVSSDRGTILAAVDTAWRELQEVLARVPSERIAENGVVGAWSAKDLVGHVATWDDQCVTLIQRAQTEGDFGALRRLPPEYPELGTFNARESDSKTSASMADLQVDLLVTHERLVRFIADLSEETVGQAGVPWRIAVDTYEHYEEHTRHLLGWIG